MTNIHFLNPSNSYLYTFLVEYLKKKLEYVKSSRLELESVREDLIKRLKMIHNRITLRRKEGFIFVLLLIIF